MSFSFDQFYQINRKALIWAILGILLWLLRDFFALIFMTFLLAFVAAPLTRAGTRYLLLPERASLEPAGWSMLLPPSTTRGRATRRRLAA